jgi:hypothetical protein
LLLNLSAVHGLVELGGKLLADSLAKGDFHRSAGIATR